LKENFTEPDVSKFLWIKSEHIISEIRKKETRKEICEMLITGGKRRQKNQKDFEHVGV